MIRLVLFDIDGTLILTGGAGQEAFCKVCETIFGVPDGTRNLDFAGRTDRAIVRDFFQNNLIPPTQANFQKFFDTYVFWLDYLLDRRNGTGRVLPGVEWWLRDLLHQPRPPVLGLLTGNIRLGAQIKLQHFKLWDHFQTGAFGDDHEDRKHVARVAWGQAKRELKPPLQGGQILIVGDTPWDIECARAIGAQTLAVATGTYSLEQLRAHRPTWLARDLEQIQIGQILGSE